MKSDGKQDDIQQTATSRIWTWVWTSCPSGGTVWTGGVLQFLLFMSFMFSNVFTSLPFLCQYIFLLFFVSFSSNRALTDVIVNSSLKRSLKYKHFNRSYCGSSFKRDTSRKQIIISHQIRSLLRTEVLCWSHQSLEERLCVSNTKDTNQRICS